MKNAVDFDKVYRRLPVKILDYEATNGVLILDGDQTVLQTSGVPFHLQEIKDENGWFDLRIAGPDGKIMLLHNAILLSSTSHHTTKGEPNSHSAEIYPNFLIDDIRGLDSNRRVRRVIFRITGLRNFFYYRHVEPLLRFSGSDEQISFLRSMRISELDPKEPFNPENVYVAHNYPVYFSIRIEGRTHEVYAGGHETFGLHKIAYEAIPTASISFDEPINFDDAIGHALSWRRLFSQLAMMPLGIEELSVQGENSRESPVADVYLTNSAHEQWSTKGYYSLSPREQPFNEWDSRKALGEVHRKWLEKEPSRRRFRIALDKVLEELVERSDASQLLALSAAIEGLKELGEANDFPVETIREMAIAAQKVSEDGGYPIPLDRILGLLGSIARPSLAHKITALGSRTAAKPDEVALICKAAVRVRNLSAHGGQTTEQKWPIVSPTVRALAALCARFDLETCGFPSRSEITDLMPVIWQHDSVEELKRYLAPD